MTATTASTPPAASAKPSDWQLLRRVFLEIEPSRATLAFALFLYVPLTLAQIAQPVFIGFAVDQGFRTHDAAAVSRWASAYLGAVLVRSLVEMVQLFILQRLGQRAVRTLRVRLFEKIQRLPMAFFDRTPVGRVMTRVSNDTESVAELFASGSVSIIGDLIFLAGTLVMLLLVDIKLSAASLVVIPGLVIGVQWFRRRARVAFGNVRAALSTLNAMLQEQISGMALVQLFAQGRRMRERFDEKNAEYMLANREAIALDAGVYAFVDAIGTVALALALVAGDYLAANHALSLGVLVLFIEALGRFFIPIRELSNKTTIFQNALVAAERIVDLENEPETIGAPAHPIAVRFERELSFDDVHFRYGDGPEVLRGLVFTVQKGERVALVGHTGAGKSTIVKLVPRVYDVTGGAIRIDGVDLREVDPMALKRLTAAVPQDVFLFATTLRDNLKMGKPDATDAELLGALLACQADALLERHGGLDAVVAERGQNFSLGERQLIAMARALISDPPIVILDEATASVDRQTERRLQAATEKLLEGRTALIVAHRLSTIERCDRIFVLHQGVIAEQGTHAELIAQGGRYAMLVDLQKKSGA
jgi:ATP-binding cassette, subfamily B, multidrug efflux pump